MIIITITSAITEAISGIQNDSVVAGIQKEISLSKSIPFVLTEFFAGLILLFYLSYLVSRLTKLDKFEFKEKII